MAFSTQDRTGPAISRNVLFAAAGVVMLLVVLLAVAGFRPSSRATGPDAYAPSVVMGDLQLSEAINGTGGKVTYIDGSIRNNGDRTLTDATVALAFTIGEGNPPHVLTAPVMLVRTRVPYVDLERIAAEPLAPGQSHDFRLIVDQLPAGWDTKPPAIRVVHTTVR